MQQEKVEKKENKIKSLKVCLGIISYLPEDKELRRVRLERLNNLLSKCDEYFGLPVYIIAQNWQGLSIKKDALKCPLTIFNYKDRLGINKARKELRQKFLESDFDYIIHLDDDCDLQATKKGVSIYLYQLLQHPGMFSFFRPHLLKLAAISKEVYNLIDIPEGGADDPNEWNRYFEDMYMELMLNKHYPDKRFNFIRMPSTELSENSNSAYDKDSTGWHNDSYKDGWSRRFTGNNTRYMIKYSPKEALTDLSKVERRDHLDYREKKNPDVML